MDLISNTFKNFGQASREKFFELIGNNMEKGYKFIRIKQPRTDEQ